MQAARKVTSKDYLIWRLLQDPHYRVMPDGTIMTQVRPGGLIGEWRQAGWVSPSRGGQKLYRRLQYQGHDLYEHRIVFAARKGRLSPFKTINHDDLNGLNNGPRNLDLTTPGENMRHARKAYKRMGMSAAECKRNWINTAVGGRQINTGESNSGTDQS